MPPRLTALRLQLLRTLARLTREGGHPPSAEDLARASGLSAATISFHLRALRELGYVTKQGRFGGLQLSEKAQLAVGAGIPIYGQIAAGPPILADQSPDHVTPSLDALLGVREGDFLLEVRGDSMTGIGVMPGDYVVVRPAAEVLDGEVAVVLIPGEGTATLKRLYRFGDEIVLMSENSDHPRMTFPADQVVVQGRMIARLGVAVPRVSKGRS
ncbi:transcriptional repressor LexA [Deinococcus sp. S9]|uniref:transcriptional repressor LexA n=1 Tax=Deinococcus sp. S9 TaxID=2545754 RepID=UPI00105451BC|nr:transcriptional repressor LexA [Deinococcus sp. S9]TDE85049.1 repressor LexA [Deinococcus sp. S9]